MVGCKHQLKSCFTSSGLPSTFPKRDLAAFIRGRGRFGAKLKEDLTPITIFSQLLLTCSSQWPLTRTIPLWCGLSNNTYLLPFRAQVKHDDWWRSAKKIAAITDITLLSSHYRWKLPDKVLLCHKPFQQLRWYRRGNPELNPLGGCFSIVHHRRILRPSADRAVPIRTEARFLNKVR